MEIDSGDRQLIVRALALQSILSPGFSDAGRRIAEHLQMQGTFDEFMHLLADRPEVKQLQAIDRQDQLKIGTRVKWIDDGDEYWGEITNLPERVDGLYTLIDDDEDDWELYGYQLEPIK